MKPSICAATTTGSTCCRSCAWWLFPLNPALAWMERRLCREREMACDEGVVRSTQAPRAYAACLASLAERRLERRTRPEASRPRP